MLLSRSISTAKMELAASELFSISEDISRKYAPVIAAKSTRLNAKSALSTKDLAEISEEISRKYRPQIFRKQPTLVLLPVSPGVLNASWKLPDIQANSAKIADNHNDEMVLRIYPDPNPGKKETAPSPAWFDVVIDDVIGYSQPRQSLQLPGMPDASTYKAEIGTRDKNGHLSVLASSRVVNGFHSGSDPHQTNASELQPDNGLTTTPSSQDSPKVTRKNPSGQGKN